MTKNKSSKKVIIKNFSKHVALEKLVQKEIKEREILRSLKNDSTSRKKNDPVFIENIGDVAIFSMTDIETNIKKADEIYGEDRVRYAKNLLTEIGKRGNRKNLAGPPLPQALKDLRRDFPNFNEAIDRIENAAALSRLSGKDWFQMQPLLLLGPAGVGKTAFAQAFANILNVNFRRLDVGTISTGSMLAGLSLGWGSGHVGEVLKTITNSSIANPLVMLDEIDKIPKNSSMPIEPVLLSLLEKETSASFMDEALLLRLNCQHILWIGTANEIEKLSDPLKSRFIVVHVQAPSKANYPNVLRSIYLKILNANPWGRKFEKVLHEEVIDRLSTYSPREASNMLLLGMGKAAIRGNTTIDANDIPMRDEEKSKFRMGFL